jgi:hypothetical protein
VSASARGTASNYSKGSLTGRADFPTPAVLLAALALAGALLLGIAELSPLYTVVVGSLQTPRRSVTCGSNHGYALVLVALAALVMIAGALRGSRAAAIALVALGAAALVVAFAVDRPDTRASGSLPEAIDFTDAQAKPASGYTLEIAGGLVLVVAGGGLVIVSRRSPQAPSSRRGARAA